MYLSLKARVAASPYADDIRWAEEGIRPPQDPNAFLVEYIFVVVNSGMKAQIARQIYNRVFEALISGRSASTVFGHKAKAAAIDLVWKETDRFFEEYRAATDKLAYLETLPWIGPITKFHLAKNFGLDVVKPDRHLVRIAALSNETPDEMCRRIAQKTGDTVAVVDTVIWRAANQGWA